MVVSEDLAKRLLARGGIRVPRGHAAASAEEGRQAASDLGGEVVVKALVPSGKRGKVGAVRFAGTPEEAEAVVRSLLGLTVHGHLVSQTLVEERVPIARELYAAVLNDTARACPLLLCASEGGMDIEEIHASAPDKVRMLPLDIRHAPTEEQITTLVGGRDFAPAVAARLASTLTTLYELYRALDADLVEINPLALCADGSLVALDCKLSVDDGALRRHSELPVPSPAGTPLEVRARGEGLLYIELDGNVGVLANGAGLTMATMDAVTYYGGKPANFMEIGGDAYKKAAPALSIVLGKPGVQSLLVNLCGAFARTDVMVQGILSAWRELKPNVPVAFSIHGTGEEEAIRLVRDELGIEPHDLMDDAVRAAVDFARRAEVS